MENLSIGLLFPLGIGEVPAAPLQLRRWISNRSGRKVRGQLGHLTRAF